MSTQGGAKARHRASSSRVVPAIPLALEARSRRSVEQNKLPKADRTFDQSPSDDGHTNAAASTNGAHVVHPLIHAQPNEVTEAVLEEPAQAGSESSQTDAAPSSQTNGLSSGETGSEPPLSTTSITFPKHTLEQSQQGAISIPPPSFGGRPESPQLAPRPILDTPTSSTPLGRPPPVTAGPHADAAPFVPNGHNYHSSEPYVGPVYPPSLMHGPVGNHYLQDANAYNLRGGHGRPFQAPHPRPVPKTGDAAFQPRPTPNYPPGSGATEHISAIHPTLVGADSTNFHQVSQPTMAQPIPPAQTRPPPNMHPPGARHTMLEPEMAFMTAAYIYEQFAANEFADYLLSVSHSLSRFAALSLPAHAIILARSPKLRRLFKEGHTHSSGETTVKELSVVVSDPFLHNEKALFKAISRLYTGALPDPRFVIDTLGLRSPRDCMQFALSYAAAGHFLEIDEIISSGVNLTEHFLSLDTLDIALAFATDGGISHTWSPKDNVREEVMSHSPSADGVQAQHPVHMPTYGIYSDRLLGHVFNFLFAHITPLFILDTKAPQLVSCPRLPVGEEHQHTRSNSRLTQIRFGEMRLDDDNTADPASQALSSVLLSLPYTLLKHFLEHRILASKLGTSFVADMMGAVVNERESRRRTATQLSKPSGPLSASEQKIWQNVEWVERTEHSQQHPCGLMISRRQLAPVTPTSDRPH